MVSVNKSSLSHVTKTRNEMHFVSGRKIFTARIRQIRVQLEGVAAATNTPNLMFKLTLFQQVKQRARRSRETITVENVFS